MTYKDMAKEMKLNKETTKRYIKFMEARWPEREAAICEDGYARQWAHRFKRNEEFIYSDSEGRRILMEMLTTAQLTKMLLTSNYNTDIRTIREELKRRQDGC